MVVAVLAAWTLISGQTSQGEAVIPKVEVTYEARACSVRKVVAELAKLTGAPLEAAATLEDEIVAVRVKDVPLSELMDHLAGATCTRWVRDKSRIVLERDKVRARAQENAELDARVAMLKKSLEPFLEMLPVKYSEVFLDQEWKRFERFQREDQSGLSMEAQNDAVRRSVAAEQHDPSSRALFRALARCDLRRIAALRPGERIVFSSAPTRVQFPCPGATSILDDLVREQAIWVERLKKKGELEFHEGFAEENQGDPRPEHRTHLPLRSRPVKFLLAVERDGRQSLRPHFVAFDADGFAVIGQSGLSTTWAVLDRSLPRPIECPKLVEFSPDAQSLIADLKAGLVLTPNGTQRYGVSADWRKRLAQPGMWDLLSLVPTDLAFSIAREKNLNLVASISDFNAIAAWFLARNEKAGGDIRVIASLFDFVATEISPSPTGWCVITPRYPAASREWRTSRKALGTLLRRLNAEGHLTIENWSDYLASKRRWNYSESVGHRMMNYYFVDQARFNPSTFPPLGYQLYGSLTQSQRETLLTGGEVPFNALSPSQKEFAGDLIFGAEALFGNRRVGIASPGNSYDRGSPSSLAKEPTEAFPLGILPGGAILTFKEDFRPLLRGLSSQAPDSFSEYGLAESCGEWAYGRARRGAPQAGGWPPPIDQYKWAEERNIEIRFAASPEIISTNSIGEMPVGWSEKTFTLDELPERHKTAFQEGWKKAEDEYNKRKPPPGHRR